MMVNAPLIGGGKTASSSTGSLPGDQKNGKPFGNTWDTVSDLRGQTGEDVLNGFYPYGYSPNQFQEPATPTTPTGGGGGNGYSYAPVSRTQYATPTLPSATSQEAYIKSMYDANQKAQEEVLRAAYEKNLGALDYQQEKIAPAYDVAANNAGAQAAIQRANFNESAAASGLNTGAGSQAELSMRNAEAANISAIRKAQADAQAELEYQRSQLSIEYQNAIREAIAQNELNKAQALYEEAKRVDESLVSTAINQANLNWNIWKYNNG